MAIPESQILAEILRGQQNPFVTHLDLGALEGRLQIAGEL